MKKIIILLFVFQSLATLAFGQNKIVNLYDSARVYYKNRDFERAFSAYDRFYTDTTHGKNNYDTYYAAIAACKTGKPKEAKKYLGFAMNVGFHYSSYTELANDTLSYCIRDFPEWQKYMAGLKFKSDSAELVLAPIRTAIFDTTLRVNASPITDGSFLKRLKNSKDPAAEIKGFNNYPMPPKTGHWTLYTIRSDTATIPFLVYIPNGYNSKLKTPLYVFLHGGVSGKMQFYTDPALSINAQTDLLKKMVEQNAFIIWPFAKKDFNWLQHQQAFETVLQEIYQVKSLYNIDDDKVYLGGHSDGGAGAFWFALNKPTDFAAVFALNYFPRLNTGNTALGNLRNELPFYGLSGRYDTGMPLVYIDAIYNFARKNNANWTNYTINGDHNMPTNMPDSVYFLYDKLLTQRRNPFPKTITWETDNIKNGRNSWVEITQLDTLAEKASWHTLLNPTINQNGKDGVFDLNKKRSGAIQATIEGNSIRIKTSRVKRINLYFSAAMLDLSKPVRISINDKDFVDFKVLPNKEVILDEFLKTKDRTFIVAGKIELSM